MKYRRLKLARRIMLFLLLGAIVNIAVAWGCAALVDLRDADTGDDQTDSPTMQWQILRFDALGSTLIDINRYQKSKAFLLPDTVDLADPSEIPEEFQRWLTPADRTWMHFSPELRDWQSVLLFLHGWPLKAMCCVTTQDFGGAEMVVHAGLRLPQTPRPSDRHPTALPLRPLWPGFAINTLFYAAMLWLLWSTSFALRGVIRRHRGRCCACGYDLRGTDHKVCPECGGLASRSS